MYSRFHLIKSLRNRPDSFRQRMLRDIIYLTLIVAIGLILFTTSMLMKERKIRGEILLSKKFEMLDKSLGRYRELLKNNVTLISKWGKSGVIDLTDELNNLDSQLVPIVEEYPFITSFNIASSDTSYYMLRKVGDRWQSFITRRDSLNNWQLTISDENEYSVDEDFLEIIRSGMVFSILKENLTENPIYSHISIPGAPQQDEPSSMISYSYEGIQYLASFNLDRNFIENDIQNSDISDNSEIYYLTENDIIKQLMQKDSSEKNFIGEDSIDKTAVFWEDKISQRDVVLTLALQNWEKRDKAESFEFRFNTSIWWGMAKKVGLENRWIFIVLPEMELFAEVIRERTMIIYFSLFLLIIGAVIFAFLLRLYNRSQPHIITDQKESDVLKIREIIAAGENAKVEFKSTLRWHIKADKPAKEIELSVLKTIVAYLNSEGGNLLIGVQDNKEICGLDGDHFPNDDKFMLHFNNMIKQHIGLEFSKFINYKIILLDGKKVMLVECKRSTESAFLKYIEDEDFYIRVGPASRKLSTRKTIKYLSQNGLS